MVCDSKSMLMHRGPTQFICTVLVLGTVSGFAFPGSAQDDVQFGFAHGLGDTGHDFGTAIARDTVDNIYVTGQFEGSVDFDPGAGVVSLTSAGATDVFVAKFSSSGTLVWARSFGGTSQDTGRGIAVDSSGNVYIAGYFAGTADFDPGAGTSNVTSAGSFDVFVSKLDASGAFVFVSTMGGTSSDVANDIALDSSGNIYTTGDFQGTADFDPGAGTFNLSSAGSFDCYVSKLDSSGNFVWARALGGTGGETGNGVGVDSLGNVYTGGRFSDTVDFDPGAGTFNLVSAGSLDCYLSKLDSSGDFVWAVSFGSTSADQVFGIATNESGDIHATGLFENTVDFDPGAGTVNLTSSGSFDAFVAKFDSSGALTWVNQIGGTSPEEGEDLSVDSLGNVFVIGDFRGTTDFDPSASVFNLTTAGLSDIFISKFDASGEFLWAKAMGGSMEDSGIAIAVDSSKSVYATGIFHGTADFDPGAGTMNLTSAGSGEAYVSKLASVDMTAPTADTLTPATTGPTNADTIDISVTFSEDVINFDDASDLVISHTGTTHTGVNISGGPETYMASITGISGDGSFTVAVNTASDVEDHFANALATSVTSDAVAIDQAPPTVQSIVLTPAKGALINFDVTFSEPVTGVDTADFVVTTTGTVSGAVVTGVTGSDASYTVTVDSGSGSGTIRLDLADDDSIADLAGNPLGGAGVGNGGFAAGDVFFVGTNLPVTPWALAALCLLLYALAARMRPVKK